MDVVLKILGLIFKTTIELSITILKEILRTLGNLFSKTNL